MSRLAKVIGLVALISALGVACDLAGLDRRLGWPGVIGRAVVVGIGAGVYYHLVERRKPG